MRGQAATTVRGQAATTVRGQAATTVRGQAATTVRGQAATTVCVQALLYGLFVCILYVIIRLQCKHSKVLSSSTPCFYGTHVISARCMAPLVKIASC